MTSDIVTIQNLKTYFPITGGVLSRTIGYVKAVNDVSLRMQRGELISIVGESGCGKSTLGLSILGLVKVTDGSICLDGYVPNIQKPGSWASVRKDFQIIFQDPFTSLNPRHTIYQILSEPLLRHKTATKAAVRSRVAQLMEQVGLSKEYLNRFPHAFSGGQRQRISIARVIGVEPKMIICDEIVSALDVSVQAQIIQLLLNLKRQMNLSLLFITHDLSLVKAISDRVYVMYLGKIVESGPVQSIFKTPRHPYTQALLQSIPTLDRSKRPKILTGEVPSPVDIHEGCVFNTRCAYVQKKCHQKHPDIRSIDSVHEVACYYPLHE